MNKMVIGVFLDEESAEEAISDLRAMGLKPKDMSILMKDKTEISTNEPDVVGTTATGVTTGALLGGVAGFLIATGTLFAPPLGGLFIAGPLAATLGLTGVAATTFSGAVTGAVAGGLVGVLAGLGLSPKEAKTYEQHILEGGILVAVPASKDVMRKVKEVFVENDAEEIKIINQEDASTARQHAHTA